MTTSSVICLAGGDNVGVVTADLRPGVSLRLDDRELPVKDPIPFGHKIALIPIEEGAEIVKFGVPIGKATLPIKAGEHVHVHNVASAYINNAVDHYEA